MTDVSYQTDRLRRAEERIHQLEMALIESRRLPDRVTKLEEGVREHERDLARTRWLPDRLTKLESGMLWRDMALMYTITVVVILFIIILKLHGD